MPFDYQNAVIGAGASGLVIAIGLAKAKKSALLIENGNWGGDCTNFGCIPSKSLIAASHMSHALKDAKKYGLKYEIGKFDSSGALERTRRIVKEIRSHEDRDALAKIGVETLTGTASFLDSHTLKVKLKNGDEKKITAKNIVIATGSRPFIPEIEGLNKTRFCTNESIFDLEKVPEHLGIIGGGPIGCELAQCFRRLGARVTLIQSGEHILSREEKETQEKIESIFQEEGINLICKAKTYKVKKPSDKIVIYYNEEKRVEVSHLLVAIGRKACIEKLNLVAAGIKTYKRGIVVDKYGRTNTKNIYAVGDCAGRALFTHTAENEGRAVLTNLLLPWPLKRKLDLKQAIPRCTYTDPEIAGVGLSELEAFEIYGKNKIVCYKFSFDELDRAITTGREEGFIKVVTKKWSGKILGGTIAAPRAGEMLSELSLAIREKIPLRKLASLIHPYPTYSLAIRKIADQWLTKTILPALLKIFGKKR